MRVAPRHTGEGFSTNAGGAVASRRTHSVYRLARGEDGGIRATNSDAFCPGAYSLFKHGDDRWTRRFGHDVADLLLREEAGLFRGIRSDGVLLAAFPYKYVPTAAAFLTVHAVTRLNHDLVARGKPTVGYLHAFKYPYRASLEHHFPTMGEDDRRRILDNVGLSLDERRLDGVDLVVVDDIRVTGASQDRFLQLLQEVAGLRSLTVVFLCDVDPDLARDDPAVEGELNHARVETLDDVARIVAEGDFRWNIRVSKFVLEQGDPKCFAPFARDLEDGLLLELYRFVTLNEYHLEPEYACRVRTLRFMVEARNLV